MVDSMKAVTVWQPWASLLACRAKKYETRSWEISYRGPIAIHTAIKPFNTGTYPDRELYLFAEALDFSDIYSFDTLPYGCVIATAELIGCYRMYNTLDNGLHIVKCPNTAYDFDKVEYISRQEQIFGDWRKGRFAWEFANMTILPEPISVKGKQGLWNWLR
ncbi:MAG: hypothetical protein K0R50_420 [Eubacterium sp.]|nr:hypothetical protein [Eubacterium sp.]